MKNDAYVDTLYMYKICLNDFYWVILIWIRRLTTEIKVNLRFLYAPLKYSKNIVAEL
jgi:hypothetical protein